MSGGGSAMIAIPVWMLIGYPLPVAVAASNINGATWTPIAAFNYLRKLKIDWKLVVYLTTFGLFGAYFGAKVVAETDSKFLQPIIGVLIISLVCFMYFKKGFGAVGSEARHSHLISGICSIPLGFYETFFGSGNGIFTSMVLIRTRGLNLTTALGYYYLVSFSWDTFGSYLYLSKGFGDMSLVVPSCIGGVAGAHVGSIIGRNKGSDFVRVFFMTIGLVLGLKLLFGF